LQSVGGSGTAQPADLVIYLGGVADLSILEAGKQAQCRSIFAVKGDLGGGRPFRGDAI